MPDVHLGKGVTVGPPSVIKTSDDSLSHLALRPTPAGFSKSLNLHPDPVL